MEKKEIIDKVLCNKEVMERIVRAWNKEHFKETTSCTKVNVYCMCMALARANGNVEEVIEYVSKPTELSLSKALQNFKRNGSNNGFDIDAIWKEKGGFENIYCERYVKVQDSEPSFESSTKEGNAESQKQIEEIVRKSIDEKIALIKDEINNRISSTVETQVTAINDIVTNSILTEIKGKIAEKKEITIINAESKKVSTEIYHEMFNPVLNFVANNIPVYLAGPAGSGKNVLAEQVAKALNCDFYYQGPVTSVFDLLGYQDANGVYHDTPCSLAVKNGGILFKDEMDADVPEAVIAINSLLANGYINYPGIGFIRAHEKFRCIAAGNTLGRGANYDYVARNQLDAATLDRFAMVEVDYDRNIESAISGNNIDLVDFIESFRKGCETYDIHCLTTYRAISRISIMEQALPLNQVLKTCLLKGLDVDTINTLIEYLHEDRTLDDNNKYYLELINIVGE